MCLLQLKPEAYAAGWGGEPSTASEADIAAYAIVGRGPRQPGKPKGFVVTRARDSDSYSVSQRPAFLLAMIIVCGACTLITGIAALRRVTEVAWLPALGFSAVTLFFALAAHSWFRRFRNPPALATFTPLGVTNEYGQTFDWSQIRRVYKFTGVLFLRDHSKAGWVVRLDPAEVGGDQVSRAIEFIKYHAPRHLTERL